MRRIPCAVNVCLVAVFVSGPTWGQEWTSIKTAGQKVRSVRAEFVQTRKIKILKRPLVAKGTFFYKAPGSIRWEYKTPVPIVTLVKNGKVKRFLHDGHRFVRDSANGAQAIGFVMSEVRSWLRGRFKDSENFEAILKPGPPPVVELRPKKKEVVQYLKRIQISFLDTPGVIGAIEIDDGDGGTTRLEFLNVGLNIPLKDGLFQVVE